MDVINCYKLQILGPKLYNVSEDDDDSDIVNDVVKEKRFDTPKTRRGIKVTNQYNSRCIS